MEEHHLHATTSTTATETIAEATTFCSGTYPTSAGIITRLVSVAFIGIISIWANYEASKGFEVIIVNEASDTPAGRRFDLLFASNDKATRIILSTSEFAERILYPDDHHPKKPIQRVTLRLAGRNFTDTVAVEPVLDGPLKFNIYVSPAVMGQADVEKAMVATVLRGIARVWLWGGEEGAPPSLLAGMVEYISMAAGFSQLPNSGAIVLPESDGLCEFGEDHVAVAHFLGYCEGMREGFIARLNRAMRGPWHVRMVDTALGLPFQRMCQSYLSKVVLPTSTGSVSI